MTSKLLKPLVIATSGISTLFSMVSVHAELGLNLPEGVTPISHEIYDLHMLVLWLCVGIAVIVFGAMAYSIMTHRKDKGFKPATFHESTTVEILWTLIPLFILIAIAFPATKTLLNLENTEKSDVSIQVTGIQWKWKYKYLNEDIEFISTLSQANRDAITNKTDPTTVENYLLDVDNRVVVPINKKIRFLFTADDVIHAWWVPELAVKQDAIPGYINDSWATIEKPGVYRGQCAELCGKDHGFMPIVLEAKTEEDYAKWVAEKQAEKAATAASSEKVWTKEELMAQGEKVYQTSCAACHQATGAGLPGIFPAITGSPLATNTDPAGHINVVMNGKEATAMQAFKTQMNDIDLAAVITYERNALGNSTGDIIQPADIKKLR